MRDTYTVSSNQVDPRHMKVSTYRCFLPNLTGFMNFHCVGPSSQHHLYKSDHTFYNLSEEFTPAVADCRLRAPLTPRLVRKYKLAEKEGFEPSVGFPLHTLSRHAP